MTKTISIVTPLVLFLIKSPYNALVARESTAFFNAFVIVIVIATVAALDWPPRLTIRLVLGDRGGCCMKHRCRPLLKDGGVYGLPAAMGSAAGAHNGPGAAESGGKAGGGDGDSPRRRLPYVLPAADLAHALGDDGVCHNR